MIRLLVAMPLIAATTLNVAGTRMAITEESRTAMTDDAAKITATTGVELPAGSEVTYLRQDGGDPRLRAKIAMDEPTLDAFISANGWSRDEFSEAKVTFLGRDEDDWQPRSIEPFPVRAGEAKDGEYVYVGYAPADAGYVVYLLWFRT